jgi:hypothetical protein
MDKLKEEFDTSSRVIEMIFEFLFNFFFFCEKKQLFHGIQDSSLLMSDFVFDAFVSLVLL